MDIREDMKHEMFPIEIKQDYVKINVSIMVYNEEDVIIKTLNSCKKYIKKLFILDTGSTDKTVELIEKFCSDNNIGLCLKHKPMIDFSTNRNYLLSFTEEETPDGEFYMLLDANDELRSSWNFPSALANIPTNEHCIMVYSNWEEETEDDNSNVSHIKILLIRKGSNVRYKFRCHEFLVIDGKPLIKYFFLQDVSLYQNRKHETIKTSKRYPRDIQWLTQDLEDIKKSEDKIQKMFSSRVMYYLARTYHRLDDIENCKRVCADLVKTESHMDKNDYYNGLLLYCEVLSRGNDQEKAMIPGYLLEAYDCFPDKIDALTVLTSLYVRQNKWRLAFHFASMACEKKIDFTTTHCYNILDYHINRWYLLALTAFNVRQYNIGRMALHNIGDEAIKKYKCSSEKEDIIAGLRTMYYPFYNLIGQNKIILVFGGISYGKWDGSMINTEKGLGGSETVITYISLYLQKKQKMPVFVCCDTSEIKLVDDVIFFPMEMYDNFVSLYNIEYLIVFRFSPYLRYYSNVKNCILFLEDCIPIGHNLGSIDLPYDDKLKYIVCKTFWHRQFFLDELKKQHPDIHKKVLNKIRVIGNAIVPERFLSQNVEKKEWRFIYSSCPTRGAWNMCRLIPKIRQLIPSAEFHFFMDFQSPFYQPYHRIPELEQELTKLKQELDCVYLNGRISQKQLAIEMLKSDIWLYPTFFRETFCITALEMQLAKCLCIYSNPSCLNEVVGNRGIMTKNDVDTEEYDREVLEILRKLKEGEIDKESYINKAYVWAMKQSWENRITEVLHLLNDNVYFF
jgi:glycosyltransferase involved in cell wall biosynthesis